MKLCQKIEDGIAPHWISIKARNQNIFFLPQPFANYSEGIFSKVAQVIRQKVFVCLDNLLITETC